MGLSAGVSEVIPITLLPPDSIHWHFYPDTNALPHQCQWNYVHKRGYSGTIPILALYRIYR